MSLYRKAIVAVAGAVLMLLPSLLSNGISRVEWVQIVIAAATAAGVWVAANTPALLIAKSVIAAVLAAANLLVTYLAADGHLTSSMIVNLVIAAVVAAGVYTVPNAPKAAAAV